MSRATDGTIRNCRIFNASPGYGLVQLHGAQSLHFEDLYAKGGVALRLETGAVKDGTEGAYDVIIENVTLGGFKYNTDKKILTPNDARPGKWA